MLNLSIPTPDFISPSTSSLADILKELDDAYERYRRESDSLQRRKLQSSIQRALIRSQELGDEKIQIAGQMVRKKNTLQLFRWSCSLARVQIWNVCNCLRVEQSFPISVVLRKSTFSHLNFTETISRENLFAGLQQWTQQRLTRNITPYLTLPSDICLEWQSSNEMCLFL